MIADEKPPFPTKILWFFNRLLRCGDAAVFFKYTSISMNICRIMRLPRRSFFLFS